MRVDTGFPLQFWDYVAFGVYFVVLSFIGLWAGRKKKKDAADYFLAGRSLPWYVVGGSFIASNISTEHFVGMIGAAYVYGICVAQSEWSTIVSYTLLIWFFIPFLMAARVFTTPEFLERRFNAWVRHFFAVVTVVSNVVAFLAAVLYGGGLALHKLFGWNLWFAIVALGVVAGSWAIYGGLRSVAWTDLFTVAIMIAGGFMVTILGLLAVSGESHSLVEGLRTILEKNRANEGIWAEAVMKTAQHIVHRDYYNRLAILQPISHEVVPWPALLFAAFYVGIWYNVVNQFMIQRVLGAKNLYHARMGIVFASYLKIVLPIIIVLPGLIFFAKYPELMLLPWSKVRPEADKGYIAMLQLLVPVGLRGLFLAALFGAIQSTVNSVLNSTATVFTLDIYKRLLHRHVSETSVIRMGIASSVAILVISIVLAGFIGRLSGSLFVYIQSLYAFFAPPFSAIFLLGVVSRRINGTGATVGVALSFVLGIGMKIFVQVQPHPIWLEPFAMQAIVNFVFCAILTIAVSLATDRPRPEQVTDDLTLNWRKLNIFADLGNHWFSSVTFWWAGAFAAFIGLVVLFSGRFL